MADRVQRFCATIGAVMSKRFFEIAFSDDVLAIQKERGSRRLYERAGFGTGNEALLSDAESDFIESRDGFYLASVGAAGWPYIQFRGGPRGFLRVIDRKTIAFADFRGNRQYISAGNVNGNGKVALFLMDYAGRRRLKILATAGISDDPDLIRSLSDPSYRARIERAFVFKIDAFDWNCPQHITERFTIEEIREMVRPLNEGIERLEREVERLKRGEK